ncbi:LysR family transcriptional regulator [soil metagenome]
MINLRRLAYFVAVAEDLHFGRAAARLGIAQPPLSQQIRKLEAELEAQLFDRSRRKVALTNAGTALLPEARRLLSLADQVTAIPRDIQKGRAGLLRLGFTGSAGYRLIPTLLRHSREHLPDVSFELNELPTADQLARIEDGTLDLGLVRPPVLHGSMRTAFVWTEPFVAVLPAGHRFAEQDEIDPARLRDEPFVMFPRERGPGLFETITRLCETHGFAPRVTQEAVQMPTIVGLVAAGLGVSIVPASVRDFRLRGVKYLPLTETSVQSTVALVWNPELASALRDRWIEVAARHTIPEDQVNDG